MVEPLVGKASTAELGTLLDHLLIDEIGKEISGSGMDTNVVGRKEHEHQAGPDEFPT